MSRQVANKKQEFALEQAFAMWLNKSKEGHTYLTGKLANGVKVVGFLTGKKKNPKEPDVRIYRQVDGKREEQAITSLWCNVSKAGKKYLSGTFEGKKIVGFINDKASAEGNRPYFSCYYSDSEPKKQEAPAKDEFMKVPDDQDHLPFD